MSSIRSAFALVAVVGFAVILSACSAVAPVLVGPTWKLVAVGGQPPAADAQITFSPDGQVSFQTGCNSGGGDYRIEAAHIAFGTLMATEMACDEPRMAQEATFLSVLTPTTPFVVAGDRLTLGSGDGTLTFARG